MNRNTGELKLVMCTIITNQNSHLQSAMVVRKVHILVARLK